MKFGERIGISASALSSIERGASQPSNQTIVAICREFGVNEQWLRTGEGNMREPKTRKQEIADYVGRLVAGDVTETEQLLIEIMSETTAEEWSALAKVIKRIAEKSRPPE